MPKHLVQRSYTAEHTREKLVPLLDSKHEIPNAHVRCPTRTTTGRSFFGNGNLVHPHQVLLLHKTTKPAFLNDTKWKTLHKWQNTRSTKNARNNARDST